MFKEHPRSRAQLFFSGISYVKEKTSSWGRPSPTNIYSMSLALCPEVDETININYSCADKGRCRRHRMKTNRLKQRKLDVQKSLENGISFNISPHLFGLFPTGGAAWIFDTRTFPQLCLQTQSHIPFVRSALFLSLDLFWAQIYLQIAGIFESDRWTSSA